MIPLLIIPWARHFLDSLPSPGAQSFCTGMKRGLGKDVSTHQLLPISLSSPALQAMIMGSDEPGTSLCSSAGEQEGHNEFQCSWEMLGYYVIKNSQSHTRVHINAADSQQMARNLTTEQWYCQLSFLSQGFSPGHRNQLKRWTVHLSFPALLDSCL